MNKNGEQVYPEWQPGASPLGYLVAIYRNVPPAEIEASECGEILREVEDSIANSLVHGKELLDFRNWKLDKLKARDQHVAMPRVSLLVEETSKGNLALRWYPKGFNRFAWEDEENETDFTSRIHRMIDQHYPGERPINELMFVHNIRRLHTYDQKPLPFLKHCLLLAIATAVHQWRWQLADYCEVGLATDFEFQIVNRRILAWSFFDVEERRKENEKKWIEGFQTEWGISPQEFVTFHDRASSWDKCAEMNKMLQKSGFNFPLKKVREAIQRMLMYHAELFAKGKS